MKFSRAAILLFAWTSSNSDAFAPQNVATLSRPATFQSMVATESDWSPASWQTRTVAQGPNYEDKEEVVDVKKRMQGFSPLVFAGEVRSLHEKLARATQGQGFLLMGGDCAEGFGELDVDNVRDTFRVMLQMALVLTFGSAMPIIKVGRMAGGQFEAETVPESQGQQSPQNMVKTYHQSAQILNILRAFSTGGYADISRLQAWNLDFVEQTEEGSRYRKFANKVDESLRFMKAIGLDTTSPTFTSVDFFTTHECISLEYEEPLARQDSTTDKWYACSSHLLLIGEQSRQLDGAHLEFCRGVGNPLAVKINEKCTPDELIRVIETMNPQNTPGRLTIIVQMSADKLRVNLPGLIRAVQRDGKAVLWVADPTYTVVDGRKTRDFEGIRAELRAFFDVHDEMGSHPGGVQIEMTGEDVTECTGGVSGITEISRKGRENAAPRLNGAQALELSFLIAERMRSRLGLPPLE